MRQRNDVQGGEFIEPEKLLIADAYSTKRAAQEISDPTTELAKISKTSIMALCLLVNMSLVEMTTILDIAQKRFGAVTVLDFHRLISNLESRRQLVVALNESGVTWPGKFPMRRAYTASRRSSK